MQFVTSARPRCVVAQQLLLITLVLLLVEGWAIFWAQRQQEHNIVAFSVSLLAVKIIGVFTLVVGYHASVLAETHRQCQQTREVLREKEKYLQLVLKAANMGSWHWDLLKNQLKWCHQQQNLFGIHPGQFGGTYEAFLEYIHPEDRTIIAKNITYALTEKQDYYDEFRIVWSDDSIRWIAIRGHCFCDETGRVVKMSGVCMDITESRQIQQERDLLLRQQQKAVTRSEAASRMKDEFLSILSHEIRTPLTSVLGWSKILRNNKLKPEKMAIGLEALERNALAQAQVIDDLLDIACMIQGKLRLEVHSLKLSSVIQEAIATLRSDAKAKDIQIQTRLEDVSLFTGDYKRLRQVLWNLLSNAIKFTPVGGKVEVVLEQVDSYIEIRVSDTGKGISADFLPYVFDRFRQEDSTFTRRYGGLGLGLAIVHHLVELHGGTISVASPGEGQGATFTVKLPQSKE